MEFCDRFLFQFLTSLENICSKIDFHLRFLAKILLHCLKKIQLLLHLFIKSCLPGTQGRILLFYFNYKPLFVLPNNTFYSTLLHVLILHEVLSYCYYIAYDSKACSIIDYI